LNNELQKDALIYIASKELIHGDIKPGNILVSTRDGRLRAFVGDFGLTGKSGGTSIFIAPEGLDKDSRIIGKTDLYSFAVTVLFLMFPVDLVVNLLYLPIFKDLEIFRQSLPRFPLLESIFEGLRWDPEKRLTLQSWTSILTTMQNLDKNMLTEKLNSDILGKEGVVLYPINKALENEGGFYYYFVTFFGFEMNSSKVNKNNVWKMTTAKSHMENLSSIYCNQKLGMLSHAIHDQDDEYVCWAYAISSMLRASIRSAVEKYDIKNGHKIMNNPSHHKMMRKELCMNIFPFGLDGADPIMAIKLLTTPSGLLDAGIYRLHTVTSIIKKFDFESQLFVNPKFETKEKEASFYSGTFEGKV